MRSLFLPLWFCVAHLVAQPTYVVKHGLPEGTQVRASDLMPDGGVVLAGAVNNQQHYVNRLDAAGNSFWARSMGPGGSNNVLALPDGKVLLLGHRGVWLEPPPLTTGVPRSYILLDTDGQLIDEQAHSQNGRQVTWTGAELLPDGHVIFFDRYISLFGVWGLITKLDLATGQVVDGIRFRRGVSTIPEWSDEVDHLGLAPNGGVVALGRDFIAAFNAQLELQWDQHFATEGLVDMAINEGGSIYIAWPDVLMRLSDTGAIEQTLAIPASMGTIAAMKPLSGGGVVLGLNGQGGTVRWGHMSADGTMVWLEEWGEAGFVYTVEGIHVHTDGRFTMVVVAGGSEPIAAIITTNSSGQVPGCSIPLSPPAIPPTTVDLLDYDPEVWTEGLSDYGYPHNYLLTGVVSGVQEQCESGFGRLSGSVYRDVNTNGSQDAGDVPLVMRPVHIEPTGQLFFSSTEGYDADLMNTGPHTVSLVHDPAIWGLTEGEGGYALDITELDTIINGLDFGLVPLLDTVDVHASLTSASTRCFWSIPQQIDLLNLGTLTSDLVVSLTLDPLISFSSSTPAPDSIVGNELFWHVDQLAPFGTAAIDLVVFTPGFQYEGTVLQSTVRTFTVGDGGALVPAGPQYDWSSVLTCAYDPNNKQVEPRGYGTSGLTPVDTEWLTYTVRFQNTGTDTAMNVVIRDQLDPMLDHSSLQVLGASHDLTHVTMTGGGLANFQFDNILLPDSGTNEAASQGYVRFRLRLAEGAAHASQVRNSAGIFFDQNPPILTNTVRNTMVDCQILEDGLNINGPGFSGMLEPSEGWNPPISWLYLDGNTYSWYLDGELLPPLLEGNDTLPWIEVDAPGTYQLVITTGFGCVITSPTYGHLTTAVRERPEAGFRAAPNPFRDQLVITSDVTFDRVELVDVNGRVVRPQGVNGPGVHVVDRGGLAPGLYLLRLLQEGQVVGSVRVVAE